MKAKLNVVGTNEGGAFLKEYQDQIVNIESLYKDIEANAPPLGILRTENNKQLSIQLIDVRFIQESIYIQCFVMKEDDSKGGKALIQLKPIGE